MVGGASSRSAAIAKVVERQMRNWELARAQRPAAAPKGQPEVQDFIAISRSVTSGGKEVASGLGQRLAWPVFDKEILDVMAGDDGLRRRIYTSMDERDLSWCEETLRVLMQPEFLRNDYYHRLTDTILSLARQGHAVFLGRGVGQILPARCGFRVRLVASAEHCAENFARRYSVPLEQARGEVARLEKERADFVRNHFHVDVEDSKQYDLLLNMDRFSPAQAVDIIIAARGLVTAGP